MYSLDISFLKPLQSKESLEVELIIRTQCDRGSEFKGRNFYMSCYLYYLSF